MGARQKLAAPTMVGKKKAFWYAQILGPMLPLPLGCWFLYKALKSFNRSPPPIATDSATVLARPLYAEPVYQACRPPSSPPKAAVCRKRHCDAGNLVQAVDLRPKRHSSWWCLSCGRSGPGRPAAVLPARIVQAFFSTRCNVVHDHKRAPARVRDNFPKPGARPFSEPPDPPTGS